MVPFFLGLSWSSKDIRVMSAPASRKASTLRVDDEGEVKLSCNTFLNEIA